MLQTSGPLAKMLLKLDSVAADRTISVKTKEALVQETKAEKADCNSTKKN